MTGITEEAMETDDKDKDDDKDDDMDFHENEPVPLFELKRTVNVKMLNPGPQTVDEKAKECETFLQEFGDSIVVKRLWKDNKAKNKKGKFPFRLTFPTEAEAEEVFKYLKIKSFK